MVWLVLGLVLVLGLMTAVVIVLMRVSADAPGDATTAPDTEVATGDVDPDADGGEDDLVTETRHVAGVPDEIPAELVTDDAGQVSGTVATRGEAWSALVSYESAMSRDELATHALEVLTGDGYDHRRTTYDDQATVDVYDGPDGSVLTVTVRDLDDRRTVGAVRVSP